MITYLPCRPTNTLSRIVAIYFLHRDGTAKVWDIETGACICTFTLEGGRQWVNAVDAWSPQQPQDGHSAPGRPAVAAGHRDQFPTSQQRLLQQPSSSGQDSLSVACGSSLGTLLVFDTRAPLTPAIRLHDLRGDVPLGCIYSVSAQGGSTLAAGTASGSM